MKQREFRKSFPRNTLIFSEGDRADCAYIIDQGKIEVSIHGDNQELVITTLGPGDLLGEMSLIDDKPRNATAVTVETVELLVIPRAYIEKKLHLSDPTLRFFLQVVMERFRDVHSRLTHVLKHLGDDARHPDPDNGEDRNEVIRKLANQYVRMQENILTAVNTPDPQAHENPKHDEELQYTADNLNIDHALQTAIANSEFELYYQPIIDLKTGGISGCEALIRWHRRDQGFTSPDQFIPAAEENGAIIPMGEWIIEEACLALAQFQELADLTLPGNHLYMSINLSARQFEDPALLDKIADILQRTGVSNRAVKFEITETLLMSNPDLAAIALEKLKALDVTLAIDDFGTGYSSFSYLTRFPIDTIKIDQSFVHTMCENAKSTAIVHSLTDLAHNLDMNVIAEGIETDSEKNRLKTFTCDYGQGYLFSRPVTKAKFIELLNSQIRLVKGYGVG